MKMNSRAFKGARKKDITDYLGLLANNSITQTNFVFNEHLPEHLWGYKADLILPVELSTLRHIRPEGFSNVEVIVELEVESSINEWENLNDPFTSLSFRSHLKGSNAYTQKIHYLSFHIDRHNGGSTHQLHPLYHLQYLQNAKMKAKGEFDHGDSLQLDIPRMMHMPMDLILGVSFLLSNYSPVIYSRLTKNRQFTNLCREYQNRVWQPYVQSLANFWNSKPNQWIWDPKLNCPYLL